MPRALLLCELAALAALTLAVTACSREGGGSGEEAPPPKANVAAADMGGAVEELTGNYGPGFTGRRLIDGLLDPTWKLDAPDRDAKGSDPLSTGGHDLVLRT